MRRLVYAAFISILVVALLVQGCDDRENVPFPTEDYFLKYIGEDGDQVAADFIQDDEGNFYVLGTTGERQSFENQSLMFLCKVNPFGEVLWQKRLGVPGDIAKDMERTPSGDFIILADRRRSSSNYDAALSLVNSEGVEVDTSTYKKPGMQRSKTVTPLSDGGFIVTGSTEYDTAINLNPSNSDDRSDIFHYRSNASLDFNNDNWYEQAGAGKRDKGIKVEQSGTGSFYVFGSSNQFHAGNQSDSLLNIYYSTINVAGVTNDFSYLGDFDADTDLSVVSKVPQSMGGGFLIAATKLVTATSSTLQVVRLRSTLFFDASDEQWDREVSIDSRNLAAVSATSVVNGIRGYLVLANEADINGRRNIWLTKLDLNGNPLWSRFFGSQEEDDYSASVMELEDGSIMVLGTINLLNGQSKIALLKLNSDGQLTK